MKAVMKKVTKPNRKKHSLILENLHEQPTYNSIQNANQVIPAQSHPQDIGSGQNESRRSSQNSQSSISSSSTISLANSPENELNPHVQYKQPGHGGRTSSPKTEPLSVINARQQSNTDPALDMAQVAFQTISVSIDFADSWCRAISKSCLTVVAFVCVPSILLSIAGCIFIKIDFYTQRRPKVAPNQGDVRVFMYVLVGMIITSVFKDVTVVVIALHTYYDTTVSTHQIFYAPAMFFILIVCCLLPLLTYAFAGAGYNYGDDDFSKSKTRYPKKAKQLSMLYMKENLNGLQEIILWRDEILYLKKLIAKWSVLIVSITVGLVCIIRSFSPLILQIMECPICRQEYKFSNMTQINASIQSMSSNAFSTNASISTIILILSAFDSLIVSLLLSAIFIYSIFWQFVMLLTWEKFNTGEAGNASLVSKGTTGVEAWWRVYQTLKFFTWSHQSVAGFLRLFVHVAFMLFIVVISFVMYHNNFRMRHYLDAPTLFLCTIDVFLLLLGLVVHWSISIRAAFYQHHALRLVSLKRLEMANEYVKSGKNDVADKTESGQYEGEYHAHLKRFRTQNLHGCLMVVKEMLPVIKDMEAKPLAMLYPVLVGSVTIVAVSSCAISISVLSQRNEK